MVTLTLSELSMLAGEIYQPNSIRLIDVPAAATASDVPAGQILFEPQLACLCGSDLLYYEADNPGYMPHVGQSLHEMIGRVVETTGDKFAVGDRVLAVPIEHYGFYGRYWVDQARAVAVDPRCSDAAAVLAQPLGTVLFALRRIPSVLARRVMLFGAGPMGQLFVRVLKLFGAAEIIVVDPVRDRLDLALAGGATQVIHGTAAQAAAEAASMPGGGPDLVIEAVGHRQQVLNECIAACRPEGEILFFGVPPIEANGIKLKEMFWKNLRMYTSVGPSFEIDFSLAMKMVAERTIDVEPLVSHRMPIDQIQEAYDMFATRREGAMKVFLDFPAYQA
ncbi:zinc-dependent alcohol dehydrogenase [Rosistilla oblonga]|nr:zinc-binding dehydrogenase [Rosistilla oblonga]